MEGMIGKNSFKGKLSEKSEGNVNFPITFLMSYRYACWLLSYWERILLKTSTNNLYYFLEAKWSRWALGVYALGPVVMEHVSDLEHASLKTSAPFLHPYIVQENLFRRRIAHSGVAQVGSNLLFSSRG